MPELVRLYIRHCLIGFAIAAAFVAGLLWLNVANLQHLVLGTSGGWLAGVMLFVFHGLLFAGVQFGIAVMNLADRDTPDRGAPVRVPMADVFSPVPVRIEPETAPRR